MKETDYRLLAHNAAYDTLALDRHNHVDALEMLDRTFDTKILAHLADPRSRSEGGVGHGLRRILTLHLKTCLRSRVGAFKRAGRTFQRLIQLWCITLVRTLS